MPPLSRAPKPANAARRAVRSAPGQLARVRRAGADLPAAGPQCGPRTGSAAGRDCAAASWIRASPRSRPERASAPAGGRGIRRRRASSADTGRRGSPLPAALRNQMEDFSCISRGCACIPAAGAARSAGSVGALAYTVGEHIVFAAGRYRPETTAGAICWHMSSPIRSSSRPDSRIWRANAIRPGPRCPGASASPMPKAWRAARRGTNASPT